jgi:hypothetical protein
VECARKQAQRVLDLIREESPENPVSPAEEENIRQDVAKVLLEYPEDITPAGLACRVLDTVKAHTGVPDPFLRAKTESNASAVALLPELRQRMAEADCPLLAGALLACAGNIIDLGIQREINVEESIDRVFSRGFARNDFDAFREDISRAEMLLYLTDNAGEIVFDRVFIEEILKAAPHLDLVLVVNHGPVLNDALMEDARQAGLCDLVRVIDNGYSGLGTDLKESSKLFCRLFSQADVIISKGQANFETLDDRPENIYFILQAKCEGVAEELKVNFLDSVFVRF